jgi:hypothetical protein
VSRHGDQWHPSIVTLTLSEQAWGPMAPLNCTLLSKNEHRALLEISTLESVESSMNITPVVFGRKLQCQPLRVATWEVARMHELHASRRGNQWHPRVQIPVKKCERHPWRVQPPNSRRQPFVFRRNSRCRPVRGVNTRHECYWSHARQRFKRSKAVKPKWLPPQV